MKSTQVSQSVSLPVSDSSSFCTSCKVSPRGSFQQFLSCFAPCSKGIIQILFRVKQVPQSGKRQFLKGLAQGTGGMTLVFMHHNDALRSGSSYQNYAHIAVDECLEVRNVGCCA